MRMKIRGSVTFTFEDKNMKVALHSAPDGFFTSNAPHSFKELIRLVRKAADWGFTCFQVGPLDVFGSIDGKRLRVILDRYGLERSVHVGGVFDAEKLATEAEEHRIKNQIRSGIELCGEIASELVSCHPPFFTRLGDAQNKTLLLKARQRFVKVVEEEAEHASTNGIKMALESFSYPPFIFNGLRDFHGFVSHFPPSKLGVLLEVGHLYQAGFDLDKAVHTFKNRLVDVHVHDATLNEDFRKATHLPIGKGTIDFKRLINALREAKYDRWLTLEIHGNERQIMESKESLEKIIRTTA